jgi:hypothetical protein
VTETFEVGQKVHHRRYGDGVITYGPYTSTFGDDSYLVRRESGTETTWFGRFMTAIPEPPKFAVGDEVTLTTCRDGARYTVEYGPFDDRDVYVVRRVDEPADPDDVRTFTALASVMRKAKAPAVKVGDRVRVVWDSDGYRSGQYVGKTGVVVSIDSDAELVYKVRFGDGTGDHGDANGHWFCAEVERVADEDAYEYDGVVYDLSAKYTDGTDVWEFTGRKSPAGVPRVTCFGNLHNIDTIEEIADLYGPLTRVTK